MKAEQLLHTPDRLMHTAGNALVTLGDLSSNQQYLLIAGLMFGFVGLGFWWLRKQVRKDNQRPPRWPR